MRTFRTTLRFRPLLVCIVLFGGLLRASAEPASRPSRPSPAVSLHPFWLGDTMDGESLMFIRRAPGELPRSQFLFAPRKVLSIASSQGDVTYEPGKDYRWAAGTAVIDLPEGSRIPFKDLESMYPAKGAPNSVAACRGRDRNLFFDNQHVFHDLQVQATYTHDPGDWRKYGGPAPKLAGESLRGTLARLAAKKPVLVSLLGDSISFGLNASAVTDVPPFQPAYGQLVANALHDHFGGEVTFKNHAVGGKDSTWGVQTAAQVAADKPDLVILAFGMNDASGQMRPEAFAANLAKQMEIIRKTNPAAEFVLVATMVGNPQWTYSAPDLYPLYRDALAKLCGPRVALADLTEVWTTVLKHKTLFDLTGNGVNHPNDFGHRVYAEVILTLLLDSP